jgi:hypothetical protein
MISKYLLLAIKFQKPHFMMVFGILIFTNNNKELHMKFILSIISMCCAVSIVSAGCERDEILAEDDSGAAAETSADDTIEGTDGMGGTNSGANEEPTEGTDGIGDTGSGANNEPTEGTDGIGDAGSGANDAVATDSGAEKDTGTDTEPVDSGVSTGDNCEKLAACCDNLNGPSRTDCRNVFELGVDEGCKGFIPTYCNAADGETVGDDGVASCNELSVCCAKQTNPVFKNICDATVSANDNNMCSFLLTLDALPGAVSCDSPPADEGTVGDDGVAASCNELSVCCAKQTNTMFKDICDAAVLANNNDTCSLLLTLDLPGGVPCG